MALTHELDPALACRGSEFATVMFCESYLV